MLQPLMCSALCHKQTIFPTNMFVAEMIKKGILVHIYLFMLVVSVTL